MKAVDTNIVLRLITGDDERQVTQAQAVLEAGPVMITPSVAMEIEWVLRSGYGWPRARIVEALAGFLQLDQVEVRDRTGLNWALGRLREGADFADMLHLLSAHEADAFVTFDRKLAKLAGADVPVPVETLR